jgi:hypothetical protein
MAFDARVRDGLVALGSVGVSALLLSQPQAFPLRALGSQTTRLQLLPSKDMMSRSPFDHITPFAALSW